MMFEETWMAKELYRSISYLSPELATDSTENNIKGKGKKGQSTISSPFRAFPEGGEWWEMCDYWEAK